MERIDIKKAAKALDKMGSDSVGLNGMIPISGVDVNNNSHLVIDRSGTRGKPQAPQAPQAPQNLQQTTQVQKQSNLEDILESLKNLSVIELKQVHEVSKDILEDYYSELKDMFPSNKRRAKWQTY